MYFVEGLLCNAFCRRRFDALPSAAAGRRHGRSPMVLLHQLGIYPQHLRFFKRCFVQTTTQIELHFFGPGPFPPPEETGTQSRLKAKCGTLRRCLLRQPCWSAASASDPGPGRGRPAPPPRRRKNPGILCFFLVGGNDKCFFPLFAYQEKAQKAAHRAHKRYLRDLKGKKDQLRRRRNIFFYSFRRYLWIDFFTFSSLTYFAAYGSLMKTVTRATLSRA